MFALFLFMQGLRLSSAPEVTIWLHQLRRAHYQVEANPGTYQVMITMQCNRGDDLASPAKASALRSHEAKSGMYQVMTYCMIQTPAKSSQHGGVEFFLLKGGINEAGWRRNGTMEGLQWAANKGGVTCECEDAIT